MRVVYILEHEHYDMNTYINKLAKNYRSTMRLIRLEYIILIYYYIRTKVRVFLWYNIYL